MPDGWTLEHKARNIAVVNVDLDGADDGHWVLLRTDAHHDNAHCDQDQERRHLEEARERGASIIDAGDMFCAMQGKWDKRADRSQCRPEHQCGDYLDALVRTAADFYQPYAGNWAYLGRGNHEQSILKHHETDLLERFAATLTDRTGHAVRAGGYQGWVHYQLTRGGHRTGVVVRVAHGAGGAAPVTKGTIQSTNRYPNQAHGWDVQFTGHVHNPLYIPDVRAMYNRHICRQDMHHIHIVQGYTYKEEFGDGHSGYHVENMRAPRATGAWWMRLTLERRKKAGVETVKPGIDIRRAM
jgi:hypothetical protein